MLKSKVYLIKSFNRESGVRDILNQFDLNSFSEADVALKANYNSSDPFPASSHPETIRYLVEILNEKGVSRVTLMERSGMGKTRRVLENRGIFKLADELNFQVKVLDELEKEDWFKVEGKDTHWLRGFYLPRLLLEVDKVVQTCCLKTHRFGGHFTLSLKNSVGLVAKRLPGGLYDYMAELHLSPSQRLMIAEINKHYPTDLVLMDATEAFLDGGPDKGKLTKPGVLMASTDRVAIDAVGVALLRHLKTTPEVSKGKIFDLDQIRRAAELEVGVSSADEIEVIPVNRDTQELSLTLEEVLKE
ncbi:MAG: DUF362 domain-containing protein [Methanobacteriaceae archaeon]